MHTSLPLNGWKIHIFIVENMLWMKLFVSKRAFADGKWVRRNRKKGINIASCLDAYHVNLCALPKWQWRYNIIPNPIESATLSAGEVARILNVIDMITMEPKWTAKQRLDFNCIRPPYPVHWTNWFRYIAFNAALCGMSSEWKVSNQYATCEWGEFNAVAHTRIDSNGRRKCERECYSEAHRFTINKLQVMPNRAGQWVSQEQIARAKFTLKFRILEESTFQMGYPISRSIYAAFRHPPGPICRHAIHA